MNNYLDRVVRILELRVNSYDRHMERKISRYEDGMSEEDEYYLDLEIDQAAHNFVDDIRRDLELFKKYLEDVNKED